jgi:hypothetical protein
MDSMVSVRQYLQHQQLYYDHLELKGRCPVAVEELFAADTAWYSDHGIGRSYIMRHTQIVSFDISVNMVHHGSACS